MIARIWRGRVRPGMLETYRDYVVHTGLSDYQATRGNRGGYVLTREFDGQSEIITLSFWDSYESIARFAGTPVDRARYYPEDPNFLLDLPETVEHYDVGE